MKKLLVLIEDDYEIMGNGLGNVAHHQYIPANFLMNVSMKLGIKLTFMVDAVQPLIQKKYTDKNFDIKLQTELWENTIRLMKSKGFDVQLHMHPQWLNAKFDGEFFYLSNNWNIGRYDAKTQSDIIRHCINYLENIIKPIDPDYSIHSFKGGSWGLQPSGDLLKNLSDNGIKIVMGVRKGMNIPSAGVNYQTLEEGTLPYYPDFSDINKIGMQNSLLVIPLAFYSPDLITFGKLAMNIFKRKYLSGKNENSIFYNQEIPKDVSGLSGLYEKEVLKFGLKPYLTHLKIGNQPFGYLKKSFDTVFNRLKNCEHDYIPVVIESHTKQYPGSYRHIEKFLHYMVEKYGNYIEFCDMTTIVKHKLQHIFIRKNEN